MPGCATTTAIPSHHALPATRLGLKLPGEALQRIAQRIQRLGQHSIDGRANRLRLHGGRAAGEGGAAAA